MNKNEHILFLEDIFMFEKFDVTIFLKQSLQTSQKSKIIISHVFVYQYGGSLSYVKWSSLRDKNSLTFDLEVAVSM